MLVVLETKGWVGGVGMLVDCLTLLLTFQVMRIPGQTSSHDPKAERQFQLSLTKILGDDNGSFDCIRQTATR